MTKLRTTLDITQHHLFYKNKEQNNHSQLGMSLISFDIKSPQCFDDEHLDVKEFVIKTI